MIRYFPKNFVRRHNQDFSSRHNLLKYLVKVNFDEKWSDVNSMNRVAQQQHDTDRKCVGHFFCGTPVLCAPQLARTHRKCRKSSNRMSVYICKAR